MTLKNALIQNNEKATILKFNKRDQNEEFEVTMPKTTEDENAALQAKTAMLTVGENIQSAAKVFVDKVMEKLDAKLNKEAKDVRAQSRSFLETVLEDRTPSSIKGVTKFEGSTAKYEKAAEALADKIHRELDRNKKLSLDAVARKTQKVLNEHKEVQDVVQFKSPSPGRS